MKSFAKFITILVIVSIVLDISEKWYNMFLLGRYWEHASFIATAFAGLICPLVILYLSVIGINYIVKS